jgi:hypothetical protein
MRGKAWRRHMEEIIVFRRMRWKRRYSYWRFIDANNILRRAIRFEHFIGTEGEFRAKTHTTTRWDTRNKMKYSPNKCVSSWRYKGEGRTREEQKADFLKLLRENGIK